MKKIYTPLCLLIALIVINSTAKAQSINISGPTGSGQFGYSVTVLTNGNYVVSDPYFDDGAITDVGAVYLYNGSTHILISTLKGSTTNDQIGNGGITALSNGNYVVKSSNWDNGAITDAGAATWGNGTTGISGVVSSSNSLIGSTANDFVGSNGITVLSNGNYIVRSAGWDNGATANAGAVTWGNGTTGTSGIVGSSNSLIGSTSNDVVGSIVITVLSNGNYIVRSPNWDNGAITDAGAVTWGNVTSGISGVISTSNSLVGSTASNFVGNGGITTLNNGNYVVTSSNWDNGAITDAGAVTWGNGTTGISGIVSSSNSLVGSTAGDFVGNSGITALSNGNYVVGSGIWDNGAIVDAGALTWGNGTTGISGIVSSTNSLVGTTLNDYVGINGGITTLNNGNYVVTSSNWDNGAITDAGAVTWGNGTTGISGIVSSSNSLVGSTAGDFVGNGRITALNNGNYVVGSVNWDNGAIADAGAATWGNGTTGITGVVSSSNSLVGSTVNDNVGAGIAALSNNNYVVRSPGWDNGAIVNAGAVTWGNGTTGTLGVVSSSNSLVGSTANDNVGSNGITALSNGNYVVISSSWDNGAVLNAGATTWGNGTTGTLGVVSSSNSLVGNTGNDNVGSGGITALSNGNYVVGSVSWDNGAIADAGAATWGNGYTGISGVVSSSNSLVGSTASDIVGNGNITVLSNGNYIIISPYWDNGAILDAGAVTWGNGSTGISGLVSSSNSLVGSTANDNVGNFGISSLSNGNYAIYSGLWHNGAISNAGAKTLGNESTGVAGIITSCNSVLGAIANSGLSFVSVHNSVYDYLIVGRPLENIVSIYNPAAIALANSLDAVTVNINGNNAVPLIASTGCRIIATLTPNGATAVNGTVNAKVWIESSVPTYIGQPFVARHYEITPATNAATATGNVTLYFTQQEFDDFNAHAGSLLDLPANAADAVGKANLRIGKYPGTSSDGSGLPGTYSGGATVIDPVDADIVWNATLSRWEVSFDVTGFSGFIVQTNSVVLPLTLLEFNGRLESNNAILNWKTENEQNVSGFEIERSIDGSNYSSIGNVLAANTAGVHQYGFTDNNISALGVPVVYYRLKQMDIDGRFVYSKIIVLSLENRNIFLLYPNPAINEINLAVTVTKGDKAQLRILDNTGRVVKQQQLNLTAGSTSLSIDLNGLSKGVYYLQLKGETINESKQFVKK